MQANIIQNASETPLFINKTRTVHQCSILAAVLTGLLVLPGAGAGRDVDYKATTVQAGKTFGPMIMMTLLILKVAVCMFTAFVCGWYMRGWSETKNEGKRRMSRFRPRDRP